MCFFSEEWRDFTSLNGLEWKVGAVWHEPPALVCDNLQTKVRLLKPLFACKTEIGTILTRLAILSAEHFNCTSDEVTWADVGTLGSYLRQLP